MKKAKIAKKTNGEGEMNSAKNKKKPDFKGMIEKSACNKKNKTTLLQ